MKYIPTSKTPLEVVYIHTPRLMVDLISLPSSANWSPKAKLIANQVQCTQGSSTASTEANAKYTKFAKKRKEKI